MYERILYGNLQLDEGLLIKNQIYHNIKIEYYKVKNTNVENNAAYGIEIVKKEYLNGNEKEEKESMKNLTKSEEKVETILEILKRNVVTPTSLEYIITDMLN